MDPNAFVPDLIKPFWPYIAGGAFPEGEYSQISGKAEELVRLADALNRFQLESGAAVDQLLRSGVWDGAAKEEFARLFGNLVKSMGSDPGKVPADPVTAMEYVKNLVRRQAASTQQHATDIEHTQWMMIVGAILTAAMIAKLWLFAMANPGVTPLIWSRLAFAQMENLAIKALLIKNTLLFGGIMAALDGGVQLGQKVTGHREEFNVTSLFSSGATGALTGLVFGGMTVGAVKLVSHDMVGMIAKDGAKSLRALLAGAPNTVIGQAAMGGVAATVAGVPMLAMNGQLDGDHLMLSVVSGVLGGLGPTAVHPNAITGIPDAGFGHPTRPEGAPDGPGSAPSPDGPSFIADGGRTASGDATVDGTPIDRTTSPGDGGLPGRITPEGRAADQGSQTVTLAAADQGSQPIHRTTTTEHNGQPATTHTADSNGQSASLAAATEHNRQPAAHTTDQGGGTTTRTTDSSQAAARTTAATEHNGQPTARTTDSSQAAARTTAATEHNGQPTARTTDQGSGTTTRTTETTHPVPDQRVPVHADGTSPKAADGPAAPGDPVARAQSGERSPVAVLQQRPAEAAATVYRFPPPDGYGPGPVAPDGGRGTTPPFTGTTFDFAGSTASTANYRVGPGETVPIGRRFDSPMSDHLNPFNDISRNHATIEFGPDGKPWIRDASSNGTWLNGERINPGELVPLKSGDTLRLGREFTRWVDISSTGIMLREVAPELRNVYRRQQVVNLINTHPELTGNPRTLADIRGILDTVGRDVSFEQAEALRRFSYERRKDAPPSLVEGDHFIRYVTESVRDAWDGSGNLRDFTSAVHDIFKKPSFEFIQSKTESAVGIPSQRTPENAPGDSLTGTAARERPAAETGHPKVAPEPLRHPDGVRSSDEAAAGGLPPSERAGSAGRPDSVVASHHEPAGPSDPRNALSRDPRVPDARGGEDPIAKGREAGAWLGLHDLTDTEARALKRLDELAPGVVRGPNPQHSPVDRLIARYNRTTVGEAYLRATNEGHPIAYARDHSSLITDLTLYMDADPRWLGKASVTRALASPEFPNEVLLSDRQLRSVAESIPRGGQVRTELRAQWDDHRIVRGYLDAMGEGFEPVSSARTPADLTAGLDRYLSLRMEQQGSELGARFGVSDLTAAQARLVGRFSALAGPPFDFRFAEEPLSRLVRNWPHNVRVEAYLRATVDEFEPVTTATDPTALAEGMESYLARDQGYWSGRRIADPLGLSNLSRDQARHVHEVSKVFYQGSHHADLAGSHAEFELGGWRGVFDTAVRAMNRGDNWSAEALARGDAHGLSDALVDFAASTNLHLSEGRRIVAEAGMRDLTNLEVRAVGRLSMMVGFEELTGTALPSEMHQLVRERGFKDTIEAFLDLERKGGAYASIDRVRLNPAEWLRSYMDAPDRRLWIGEKIGTSIGLYPPEHFAAIGRLAELAGPELAGGRLEPAAPGAIGELRASMGGHPTHLINKYLRLVEQGYEPVLQASDAAGLVRGLHMADLEVSRSYAEREGIRNPTDRQVADLNHIVERILVGPEWRHHLVAIASDLGLEGRSPVAEVLKAYEAAEDAGHAPHEARGEQELLDRLNTAAEHRDRPAADDGVRGEANPLDIINRAVPAENRVRLDYRTRGWLVPELSLAPHLVDALFREAHDQGLVSGRSANAVIRDVLKDMLKQDPDPWFGLALADGLNLSGLDQGQARALAWVQKAFGGGIQSMDDLRGHMAGLAEIRGLQDRPDLFHQVLGAIARGNEEALIPERPTRTALEQGLRRLP